MDLNGIINLLKVLTWKRIMQTAILITILIVTYGFWENRITIYNSLRVGARVEVEQPIVLNLTPGTKSYLDAATQKTQKLIAGLEVMNVNFKKNTKSTSYFSISGPELRKSYDQFVSMQIADTPLFTSNEDGNQKIIDLINGDFVCYDYKNDTGYKAQSVASICSISIPPYYGRFSGYMNVYLLKKPTTDEMALVRQIARDMSFHIYEFDINQTGKYIFEQK